MEKHNLIAGLIIVILLKSPLILALDCDSVSQVNQKYCEDILNSEIPLEQKRILISNIDYGTKFFPDHDYILEKNSDLKIDSAPEGTNIHNKKFIKKAWLDIFSVMPSVIYNGSLYSPESSSVLTGFNHKIKIPEDYERGDCKTKYELIKNSSKNRIYVNGVYQGSGRHVDINLNSNSEISSIYEISSEIKIIHYKWRQNNDKWRCEYYDTDYEEERIKIKDKIDVKLYKNNFYAKIKPIESSNSLNKLKLNFSDSIKVDFKDSEYSSYKYIYSIEYSKPPYYISTLKAKDYNQEKKVNLFKEEDNLIVKNSLECNLKAFDFFETIEKKCNSELKKIDFYIKTDKLKYERGEIIKVKIFPKDIPVNISYGELSRIAKNETEFIAEYNENRIIASYNGLKAEKVVYIINKKRLMVVWNLAVFGFLNYFFYVVIKKYSMKIK